MWGFLKVRFEKRPNHCSTIGNLSLYFLRVFSVACAVSVSIAKSSFMSSENANCRSTNRQARTYSVVRLFKFDCVYSYTKNAKQ